MWLNLKSDFHMISVFFQNKECELDRVCDIADKSPIVFITGVCV